MSLIGTLRLAARSRSIVTLTCGASKARLLCTTMKRPDSSALRFTSSAISKTRSGSWIDWMTTEIGRPPPEPGSVGGAKTKPSTPATAPSRPCRSSCSSAWLRSRSAQSSNTQM